MVPVVLKLSHDYDSIHFFVARSLLCLLKLLGAALILTKVRVSSSTPLPGSGDSLHYLLVSQLKLLM